jgi:hypothetical protein
MGGALFVGRAEPALQRTAQLDGAARARLPATSVGPADPQGVGGASAPNGRH